MAQMDESFVLPDMLLKMGSWRYPFFLVDKLTDFKSGPKGYICSVKNVTFNEPFFSGHFPEHPVMPGVLIAEVLNQTCDYHTLLTEFCMAYEDRHGEPLSSRKQLAQVLHTEEGLALVRTLRTNTMGYLASHDLKFKHPVQPGHALTTRCELTLVDNSGFVHYRVEARVGRQVACTGRIVNFRTNNLQAGRGLSGGYRLGAIKEGA